MSILDDLSTAIRTVHEAPARPSSGSASGNRGSGVVIADGRVLTNAHNLRGDEVTVTFRDGRIDARQGPRRRSRRRSRGDRGRHDRRHGPRLVRRRGRRSATSSSASPSTGAGAARVTAGTISAIEQTFRGPGGSRIGGSLEHTAPLASGLVGRATRRRRGRPPRPQHEPDRRGLLPRPSGRRRASASASTPSPAASRSSRPRLGIAVAPSIVARRLRRVGRARASGTACWSAASRTAARPIGPGSARATCSSRRPAVR